MIAAAKPELGRWGVDLAGMDRSVNPGDSFYKYVNGTWDRNTEIPADRSSWSGFGVLRDLSDQRTHDLIEGIARTGGAAGSNQQKIADLYRSFINEAAIEQAGTAPLQPYLAKIAASNPARTWLAPLRKRTARASARPFAPGFSRT